MKITWAFGYRLLDSNKYLNYNAYLGTLLGAVGIVISVIGISTVNPSWIAGIKGFGYGIVFTIVLVFFIGKSLSKKFQESIKIATQLDNLQIPIKPMSEADIENMSRKGLTQTKLYQLNRISVTDPETLYWYSSWIGSGNIYKESENKISLVESIVIKYDSTEEFYAKVPIVNTKFDNDEADIKAFKLKFVHYESGFWCAAIHGIKGYPSNTFWERSTIDLSITRSLQFYARSLEVVVSIPNKDENIITKKDLQVYVRLEDKNRNSSDGVIISVPSMWKKFEIPVSNFLINFDLEGDYHPFLKEYIFKEKEIFNKNEMMQVLIGCSEKMPNQEGTILVYNLKFI